MTDAAPGRFRTSVMVVACVLLAVLNALISVVIVATAVPGSGEIGPGFTTIGITFLIGNISTFGYALFSLRSQVGRKQVIGLVIQLLTLPLCVGVALLIMLVLGISDL